jgi:hypothetical protein
VRCGRHIGAIATVAATLVCAEQAIGATPPTGQVSAASPDVFWQGTAQGAPLGYANPVVARAGLPMLCEPSVCDVFTLDVADSADLRIESSSCEDPVTEVEVQKPDGSRIFADGNADSPRTVIDIPRAPQGQYVVRTSVNVLPPARGAYVGQAHLAIPRPITMSIASATISHTHARKGSRVSFFVATTAPVTALKAVLRSRAAVVGVARLANLDDRVQLRLRLSRSLRPGRYGLTVRAHSGDGVVPAATGVLRVRRATAARSAASTPPSSSPVPATAC